MKEKKNFKINLKLHNISKLFLDIKVVDNILLFASILIGLYYQQNAVFYIKSAKTVSDQVRLPITGFIE